MMAATSRHFAIVGRGILMLGQIAAFGVHAFTAIGAVFGFQALIEASAQRWEAVFVWLGAALIVDGLDGPLARRVQYPYESSPKLR